jgi:ubiquinone/menaquinone biosynthesis C-methylase UbiE
MAEDSGRTIYEWIFPVITAGGRKDFVSELRPLLSPLVDPSDLILDVCCGAGPFSFLIEEMGASVTGVDIAPYMIRAARDEASSRGSQAIFIESDVLNHDFGNDNYVMAVFLGNTIMDFAFTDFDRLTTNMHQSLKRGAYFVIHYIDGVMLFTDVLENPEGRLDEGTEEISYKLIWYDPGAGTWQISYRNENRDQEYRGVHTLYTKPMIKMMLKDRFVLRQSHQLSERSFLDIYQKE